MDIYDFIIEKSNGMPQEKAWCNITLINESGTLKVSSFYLKEDRNELKKLIEENKETIYRAELECGDASERIDFLPVRQGMIVGTKDSKETEPAGASVLNFNRKVTTYYSAPPECFIILEDNDSNGNHTSVYFVNGRYERWLVSSTVEYDREGNKIN